MEHTMNFDRLRSKSRWMMGAGTLTTLVALLAIPAGCNKRSNTSGGGGTAGPTQDVGWLEKVDCQTVLGWAWDKDHPDDPVSVDILDGTTALATVKADVARGDLASAGKGNGKHGFTYSLPSSVRDGKPHVIHVTLSGNSADLGMSPKTITCPTGG
jgi:hypothetical protein